MLRPRIAAAGASVAAVLCGACSSSLPPAVSGAPVLSVATGLWPLAQMAQMIGGTKVIVDDVVPPGSDPFTFDPGPAARDELRSSGLVLEIGDGFQPALEAAATGAPAVTRLRSVLGVSDPYVWLDPNTMERAVTAITAAMSAADPAAKALFARNEGGLEAELQALDIAYSGTFTTCPGTALVTPDAAFSAMASDYGLHDSDVGADPSPAQLSTLVASLPTNSQPAGLSEPWVDDSGVEAAALAGHFKVHQVSTLTDPPPPGPAAATDYFGQMQQVLGEISGALGCSSPEQ